METVHTDGKRYWRESSDVIIEDTSAEEEAYRRLAVEYVVVNTNDVDDEYRYYRETHPIKTRWGGAASIRCWGPLHAAIRFATRQEAEEVAALMDGKVEEVYPF